MRRTETGAAESPSDDSDQKRRLSTPSGSRPIIAANPGLFPLIHRPTDAASHSEPVGARPPNHCTILQIPVDATRDKRNRAI